MKFFVDENFPKAAVEMLHKSGDTGKRERLSDKDKQDGQDGNQIISGQNRAAIMRLSWMEKGEVTKVQSPNQICGTPIGVQCE